MANREWDSLHFVLFAVSSHWIIPWSTACEWTVSFFYPTVSSYYLWPTASECHCSLFLPGSLIGSTLDSMTMNRKWAAALCSVKQSYPMTYRWWVMCLFLLPGTLSTSLASNAITNRKWVIVPFILSDSLIIPPYLTINSLWVLLLSVKNYSSYHWPIACEWQYLSWVLTLISSSD